MTQDPWIRLILAALAVWRLTHLLAAEDGPGEVIARLRQRLGDGVLGRLMDCFYCLSLWVAAPFAVALAPRPEPGLLTWLALSGAACLLERLGASAPAVLHHLPNGE